MQLLIKDYQIDDNIVDILKDEYNIFNGNVLMTKIELIRQLEELLMIDLVNINTKIDLDRFDEHVEIGDILNNQINKVFRIQKKKNRESKKERERKRENMCVCIYVYICMCMCERERERERN
jgi:hypothetical protein